MTKLIDEEAVKGLDGTTICVNGEPMAKLVLCSDVLSLCRDLPSKTEIVEKMFEAGVRLPSKLLPARDEVDLLHKIAIAILNLLEGKK